MLMIFWGHKDGSMLFLNKPCTRGHTCKFLASLLQANINVSLWYCCQMMPSSCLCWIHISSPDLCPKVQTQLCMSQLGSSTLRPESHLGSNLSKPEPLLFTSKPAPLLCPLQLSWEQRHCPLPQAKTLVSSLAPFFISYPDLTCLEILSALPSIYIQNLTSVCVLPLCCHDSHLP